MADEAVEYRVDEEIKYIVKASIQLKCSWMTRYKAVLLCHQANTLNETPYDPLLIAAACIHLSIKYHEEDIDFDAVIMLFFNFAEPTNEHHSIITERFKSTKKAVTQMEFFILRMVEFDLSHSLAHEYLLYMLYDKHKELKRIDKWDAVFGECMKVVSDFYLLRKSVNYKAEDIASTVIKAVFQYLGCFDLLLEKQHFANWLKALSATPEATSVDIMEDIFRICYVISHFERKRMPDIPVYPGDFEEEKENISRVTS